MLRYHVGGIVKSYLSHDGLNSHDYDLFSKSLSHTVCPHMTTGRVNQERCNVRLCRHNGTQIF